MSWGKWDYYVKGQGHKDGLKCQWMFVWTIFSESQNILLANLVMMSQSCGHFVVVAIFKVKVTGRAHMIRLWLFLFSELLIPWQPNLVWWYIIRSQSVLWKQSGWMHSGLRYTDSSALTYTITRQTTGEGGGDFTVQGTSLVFTGELGLIIHHCDSISSSSSLISKHSYSIKFPYHWSVDIC